MKSSLVLTVLLSLVSNLTVLAETAPDDPLVKAFQQPPETARPWVYWFIMDGNLSREGITADLEAMQAAGIGGVIIMEVNVGIPRGDVEFMSPQWQAMFKHAVEEAERLGMEITLNAGPGWTGSGGPWVKAQQSMQHLVASETETTGPGKFSAALPCPAPRPPYFGSAGLPEELIRARLDFYEDVAVLAVPHQADRFRLEDVNEKALYVRDPYTSTPGVKPYFPAPVADDEPPPGAAIPLKVVIDLTDRLQPDGHLDWDVPEGSWTILRFGRRNTGANTRPAPLPGLGLECDKFDRAALDAHFEAFAGKLLETIGPRPNQRTSGWTMLHIDSWEMGSQNWTAAFRGEFLRRRGYDPLPYLPVMTGRILQSKEVSERFLWDLRLTAQELVIENHAQHLKTLGQRYGFGLSIEPYDMNPTADMTLGGVADVPMCEFWSHGYGFDSVFTCFEASSIAHTLGRPIVAAEAFTATSQEAWQLYPAAMKNQGDWAFCTGINRFAFHRFAHQPWLDRRPGMTMGPYGVHWDRTQTWWPLISAYHKYIARCQYLLRQGSSVADICYLVAEGAPNVFRPPPSALTGELRDRKGYNFDGCAPETLLHLARVEDGRLVFPGGAAYQILVLPSFDTMTPDLLAKVKELVEGGVTVVGSPPRKSPSLVDYPRCDRQVQALVNELWGDSEAPEQISARNVSRGKIVWGGPLRVARKAEEALSAIKQARWIWFPEGNPAAAAPPCRRYFRRAFTLPDGSSVRSAQMQITADNDFQVWINGRSIGSGDNFHRVFTFDASSAVQPGDNLLAVTAINGADAPNPAGLIAALHIELADGTTVQIPTDQQWLVTRHVDDNWPKKTSNQTEWVSAIELGAVDMDPWRLQPAVEPCPILYPDYDATAEVLQSLGVPPDFEASGPVRYTHRRSAQTDIYFVANQTDESVQATCQFRVRGKQPELWDPVTGTTRNLPEFDQHEQRTSVALQFEPHQSFFILFRRPVSVAGPPATFETPFPVRRRVAVIDGSWSVSFARDLGGPGEVTFPQLVDWTSRSEPGIKYYSGIATYRTTFDLPAPAEFAADGLSLDLGTVHNLARVRLNGHDLGVLWCAPWRVDISQVVKSGENDLEMEVANLWPNRLIGDKTVSAESRVAWTTWDPYRADSPLLPSGLLGPVTVTAEDD